MHYPFKTFLGGGADFLIPLQLGSWTSDKMGPRLALSVFVACQGVVGFIMSGCYAYLKEPQNIGGFVVIFGGKLNIRTLRNID